VQPREEVISRDLLDLADAWVKAVFLSTNAFAQEMCVANFGRVLISMIFVGIMIGVAGFLQSMLAAMVVGSDIATELEPLLEVLPVLGLEADITGLVAMYGAVSVVAPIVGTLFLTLVIAAIAQPIARFFGGEGSFIHTLHALTIATVAYEIVVLIPDFLGIFLADGTINLAIRLVVLCYGVVLNTKALSVAHPKLGMGRAFVTLFLTGLALIPAICLIFVCLIFAIAPLIPAPEDVEFGLRLPGLIQAWLPAVAPVLNPPTC
jgi:hypothetical protein